MLNRRFLLLLLLAAVLVASSHGAASWPGPDELPSVPRLPDPFATPGGSRIAAPAEWPSQRARLAEMIQHYAYGRLPPPPGNVRAIERVSREVEDGASVERVTLGFGPEEALRLHLELTLPDGPGPFPVVVKETTEFGHVPVTGELRQRGYGLCEFLRTDLDPDAPDTAGPAQAAYPDHDWATLAVWAWGFHRVIDYLVTLPRVDAARLAVTGHSRGGKAALLAGALDERIALTAPNGSGCGGAGCFRANGEGVETLERITDPQRFAYWFHPRLRSFAGREERLPFDQHFLKALVAPRALLTTDAFGDRWANPQGTQHTHRAAAEVYAFLGASGRLGIHFRDGDHDQSGEDWRALLDFADRVFFGRKPSADRRFDRLPFPDLPPLHHWRRPDS